MNVVFTPTAWQQYTDWQKVGTYHREIWYESAGRG